MKKLLVLATWLAFLVGCVGHPSLVTPAHVPPSDISPPLGSLPVIVWAGDLAGSTSTSQSVSSLTPSSGNTTVMPFNAGGFKAATSPFKIQDSGAVTRFSLDTTHSLFTAGGGGSDAAVSIGPAQASPATTSGVYFNAAGNTAPSSVYSGAGGDVTLQSLGAWALRWLSGQLQSTSGSLTVGTILAGNTLTLQADAAASVVQLAGGTQNGLVLGANLATVGHMRTPSGFEWMSRNALNTANLNVVKVDASDQITIGDQSVALSAALQGTSVTALQSGADSYLDQTTLHVRNASHVEYATLTPTAATALTLSANATSFAFNWAAAAGAAGTTTFTGQAAGGTNNGGPISISGGAHSGAGTFDGTVTVGSSVGIDAFVGSQTSTTRTITGNLTIDTTTTDRIIYADCTASAITITLPVPTNGRMLTIIDKVNNCGNAAGGKQLTLARHGAETIDGVSANVTTSTSGFRFNVYSDGTSWVTQNGTKFQVLLLPFILFGRRKKRAANDTADAFKKVA